jgi:hypothetical protein
MAEKLAEQGWFVRVETMDAASQPAVMNFAVGKNSSQEAIAAVLEYPGIETGDEITSTNRLTATDKGNAKRRFIGLTRVERPGTTFWQRNPIRRNKTLRISARLVDGCLDILAFAFGFDEADAGHANKQGVVRRAVGRRPLSNGH